LFPKVELEARPLSNLFLNLIKSIIAPLIFATLVVGISGTGDMRQVGRMGAKAFLYFEVVTTLALLIGLLAVNLAQPGRGLSLVSIQKTENKADLASPAQTHAKQAIEASSQSTLALEKSDTDEAMRLSTTAAAHASDTAETLAKGLTASEQIVKWCESLADVMFRFTEFVMKFVPVGVRAAMAYAVSHSGLDVLKNLIWTKH